MLRNRLASLRPLVALLPSLLIVACDRDAGDDGGEPTGTADLRMAHVAPDAPAMDVFLDDAAAPTVMDLAFAEGTEYLELDAGAHDLDLTETGTPMDMAVLRMPIDLAEDTAYTLAAFGPVESLDVLVIDEGPIEEMPAGVRLRAVHVAPDVGSVDLSTLVDGAAPSPLVTNLAFGDFSDAVEITGEPFTLGLDADDDATPELRFEIPALPEGTTANVYAVSEFPTEVFLLVQTGPGQFMRITPEPEVPTPLP